MYTALSAEISTPSSIVGEQKRTGRNTVGSPALCNSSLSFGKLGLVVVAPAKAPFTPFAPLRLDLGGVFAALDPEQRAAAFVQGIGERGVEFDEIAVGRFAVGAALARNEPHRVRDKTPAIHIEGGGHA